MQYNKCPNCKNAGNMCQMILASGVVSFEAFEITLNRALDYSRQKNKNIQIKTTFECLGFDPKEAIDNAE